MSDNADRTMRELVYRLVAMAPEAPPFPQEPTVQVRSPAQAGAPRRLVPLPVVAIAAVVVIAFVLPMIFFRDDPSSPATTQPTTTTMTLAGQSGLFWPQTSLEEVQRAQELADAGDPEYTWQRGGEWWYHPSQNHPHDLELFARFLGEVLGWEDFRWAHSHPSIAAGVLFVPGYDNGSGLGGDIDFIRCADGPMNPLYAADPMGAGCAPTLDDLRYETVRVHVEQLVRPEDPFGIFVVTRWEILEPFEQSSPPSETDIAALLEPFLQARIDGEGADGFVYIAGDDPLADVRVEPEIPLLYASSSGTRYVRSEYEVVAEPAWPLGATRLQVRLFTGADETVVEQRFSLERDEAGRLRIVFDFVPTAGDERVPATTENTNPVPEAYSFLGGAVTYRAAHPYEPGDYPLGGDTVAWERGPDRVAIIGGAPLPDQRSIPLLLLLADPRPVGPGLDCEVAPTPGDAAALASSVVSDPDFDATAPMAVTIGGVPALQIDLVVKQNASWCWAPPGGGLSHHALFEGTPMSDDQLLRLYLLDLPGEPARVLAIVIFNADLEQALALATPIVESIEFRNG